MTEARHHHYLPQCYLRGFTKGGGKKSKLKVFDVKRKSIFETSPRNVGGRRDFNRIEIDGVSPNAVESGLSLFETKVASSIRHLNSSHDFSGETKIFILNLIALLAVRSPQRREQSQNIQNDILKLVASWEAKAFNENNQYTITIPTERHIRREMDSIEGILPFLYHRKWLVITSDGANPFITTDNPVVLFWNHSEDIPPLYRDSPGFGLPDTCVQIALSKDIVLIGNFDGKEGVLPANRELVAMLNTRAIISAYEQIYAPSSCFQFYLKKQCHEGMHLFSRIAKASENENNQTL